MSELDRTLCARGVHTIAAVNPVLLGDRPGEPAWQWLLGTPIDNLPFDALSFMAYTSLLEGYSRRTIDRRVAISLLAQTAQSAQAQWGAQANLSLGTVGGGALGDERPYRSVDELIQDVAVSRACGVDDLSLFDLSGVLEQAHPEAWLDAFVHTPPAAQIPRLTKRARLIEGAVRRTSDTIGLYRRLRKR